MSWLRTTTRCALGWAALSCGVDQTAVGDRSGDDGSSELPDTLSKMVGPEGAEMRIRGVTLSVPAGALRTETLVTVSNMGSEAAGRLAPTQRDVRFLSPPALFTPHGLHFSYPVQISMTAETPQSQMVIRRLDDEKDTTWEEISSQRQKESSVFETSQFSIYALTSEVPLGTGGAESMGIGGRSASSGGASVGGSAWAGALPSGGAMPSGIGGWAGAAGEPHFAGADGSE